MKPKYMPLSFIPNTENFTFIGVASESSPEFPCRVLKDHNGSHYVINDETKERCFLILTGWRRIDMETKYCPHCGCVLVGIDSTRNQNYGKMFQCIRHLNTPNKCKGV